VTAKRLSALIAVTAALAMPATGSARARHVPQKPEQQQVRTDWTSIVIKTPEFGFRMGNPNARVKLIEYGALSCPHCAHFEAESATALTTLVKKGSVSYEFRRFLIHPQDLPASLLAGCNGPARFFPIARRFFRNQQIWLAKSNALTPQMVEAWAEKGEASYSLGMGDFLGLPAFVAPMGITPRAARNCMTNGAGLLELRAIGKLAQDTHQVDSTPTFIINGTKAEGVNSWIDLEPLLKAAGG
jgi:protein-disulfide isomerase